MEVPAVTGTLDRYVAEINRFEVLTAEEEFRLAVRFKKKNDLKAAEKLVVSNLRFVVKIAHEYRNYGIKLSDLVQEGNIGLIKAVREKAVRDQQAYIITFDLSENRIWFRQESAIEVEEPDEVKAEALQLAQPIRIVDIWTRSAGTMDEGQPQLWVSRQGYIDETMIHLENDDDEVLSMLFSPFLGNVRITDSYVEME